DGKDAARRRQVRSGGADAVAAAVLGLAQRRLGGGEEGRCVERRDRRRQADADRQKGGVAAARYLERLARDAAREVLRECERLVRRRGPADDAEAVAVVAGERIVGCEAGG